MGLKLTAQVIPQNTSTNTKADTLKNNFSPQEKRWLGIPSTPSALLPLPSNIKREVTYDAKLQRYIVVEKIGDKLYGEPQYLSIEQYLRLVNSEVKKANWRRFSNIEVETVREKGIIPRVKINNPAFEKIFGGTNIDILPRGEADLTFMGRINKNENPLFTERQRTQGSIDFNQRIQMDLMGNIGEKLKVRMNYNTEAQFDFENQIKIEYTGTEDEIIKKVEAGNVNMPMSNSLIPGTQSLFGIKTQLQFGKLDIATLFSQQKSQSREIKIQNGAQQNEFSISASEYDANRHYFLAQYFRDNYNRALSNAPNIFSNILITRIEVWITNRNANNQDSRDILAFLDLGENNPHNTAQITGGGSNLPSGLEDPNFPPSSNNLLRTIPASARQSNSNEIISYFQANGGTDNYAKVSYARKLTEKEFIFQPQLGYISLNQALNADEVLAVAYRYTYNGREYQVGEFSTESPFDPSNPKVLYTKLLKNETIKTNLPTWDLMMKNIYYINGSQIARQNFILDIFRIDDKTGVESPMAREGQRTMGIPYLALTYLDQLNPQKERKRDGVFDFEAENKAFQPITQAPVSESLTETSNLNATGSINNSGASILQNTSTGYITIDPNSGRIIFPVIEPFGKDLEERFVLPGEQVLAEKYSFKALYDSVKVVAQQRYPQKNVYQIKGSYQSEMSTSFPLNAINVPEGSVRVFIGNMPLTEGTDYTVDYQGGFVNILNPALLNSGQSLRINTEETEMFGLQQRSLFGTRLDFRANPKLNIGATFMNLTERPLTQKVNFLNEPISNSIFGADINYSSNSRLLTKIIDKLPFLSTKEMSSISLAAEYAQLIPGHPKAINVGADRGGSSYLDDFEATRQVIDLKSAMPWQISSTPQLFPEAQLMNNLEYGYNRAKLAFYNIDPSFYNRTGLNSNIPSEIRNDKTEQSNHYVRQVYEQEVFPYKEISLGNSMLLPTLDLAFYPMLRGPYNYTPTGFNPDGTLQNPRTRWGGMMRKIDINDFESNNIEYIEMWMMDPFLYKKTSAGGDLYLNLGNLSEDILKDGRKALENALPINGDPSKYDETEWGRVSKLQPVIQVFDNDPTARKMQDVGLDGLRNEDERLKFRTLIERIKAQLNPAAASSFENDPSSDDFSYFRGNNQDQAKAGILKRYMNFNGPDGNSRTPSQSMEEFGVENAAATSLPDGEDINRDNNMTQSDEYFQYKLSLKPGDLIVGQNFITDKIVSQVKLANGQVQPVTWYQIRIPLAQYQQKYGNIQDFKSIRFMRMFLTNFTDTVVLRMAKLQLVKGDWRRYNAKNESNQLIVDPALIPANPDQSTLELATVSIEENGRRSPIPYVVPPGILRERDFSNFRGDTRMNEQSLSLKVINLKDGYGRAAFKTAVNDFRSYKRLKMYVHLEALQNESLRDGDLHAFLRIGTDNQDNYYEYSMPLQVTMPGASDPFAIWPQANEMDIELELFQKAKIARNSAIYKTGGAWPINIPFTYTDGLNQIIVKGQPDLSKVRVYMLGLKNPLRSSGTTAGDDGMEKSGEAWFNELRLSEFDERGGWAATARMNAKLADFGDINLAGSYSTIGFGSIEKKVSERNRSDQQFFDLSTNLELGKFFSNRTGLRIPMFLSYSNQIFTPQFDPRMPDVELKRSLEAANRFQKNSILKVAQDYTVRSSLNFTNVRKERTSTDAPVRLWDIENFSFSYAQTNYSHRDFINANAQQQNYRGSVAYNYAKTAKVYQPFQNLFKSNLLTLLKDFNFSLLPSSINFRLDLDRFYAENTLRDNDPNNYLPIQTTYNKNFLVTRAYGIAWDLSQSLTLDINATNYAIVDEPEGRINGLKRDTLWQNLLRLGRTTDYSHLINLTYQLPIEKIPGLDWINIATTYGSSFNWQTEPLSTLRDPNINLGNTIQNSRIVQVNPNLNFTRLYNKFGILKRSLSRPIADRTIGDSFVSLLTAFKNAKFSYVQNKGTFLPGFMPRSRFFGMDGWNGAPGLGFVLGSQNDIREEALSNGWLSNDDMQNQMFINTLREEIQFSGLLEPIPDFKITLTALRGRNLNFSTNLKFNETVGEFEQMSPTTQGDYSISIQTWKTAFRDKNGATVSQVYAQFLENRHIISQRLGQLNPNSQGTQGGFANGYLKESQDVIVASFLAAYQGKDATNANLRSLPKFPLPNWNVTYDGLTRFPFVADKFFSVTLKHLYTSVYSVNGFNSLIRYEETEGFVSSRDLQGNFLPQYQFNQISISERFAPLIGVDARLKSNLSTGFEYHKTRLLAMSLANSQLAQLSENNMVIKLGYRTNNFRFPFGLFKGIHLKNTMDFNLDVSIRDNKTVIYRAEVPEADVSAGAKNITFRPNINYVLNQRFNLRIFYDTNITKPYTSQSFNTAFTNFGVSLRVTLN
ncbi:MAG: cell surface protein SprA [Pedobacter sp.]|nr:MAG: cell surface protein SprA [Pedobacter sp.]